MWSFHPWNKGRVFWTRSPIWCTFSQSSALKLFFFLYFFLSKECDELCLSQHLLKFQMLAVDGQILNIVYLSSWTFHCTSGIEIYEGLFKYFFRLRVQSWFYSNINLKFTEGLIWYGNVKFGLNVVKVLHLDLQRYEKFTLSILIIVLPLLPHQTFYTVIKD